MTFIEWCLESPEEEIYIDIRTTTGRRFLPGETISIGEVERLKPLKLVGEPKLRDNVWYITLDDK